MAELKSAFLLLCLVCRGFKYLVIFLLIALSNVCRRGTASVEAVSATFPKEMTKLEIILCGDDA